MDNQAYIREEIKRMKNKRNKVVAQSIIPNRPVEKRAFLTTFLGSCILMVTVITLGGMILKHGNLFASSDVKQIVNEKISHKPVDNVVRPEPNMTQREGQEIKSRLNVIESDMETWAHRQWLLSLAVNENSNIAKDIDMKYHGNEDSGFISFDEKWKMNKIPKTMTITEEQKDSIRNGP